MPLHYVIHHSRPDGSRYPIKECVIDMSLSEKQKVTGEDYFVRPNGKFYPAAFTLSPIIKKGINAGALIELRDITLEKRAENELRQLITITEQRNSLIKLNKTKDEFIALASHQLRTPATAVKQYIGLLLSELSGPISKDQARFLETAYKSNERQLDIINELLKTAQMDSGKYNLNKKRQNLSDLLKKSVTYLKPTFEMRQQTLDCKIPPKKIIVLVDSTELNIVLVNLLENASKYSFYGGHIKVTLTALNKFAQIKVADTGVGISRENQRSVFDKFTRINNELSDTVAGTGLGYIG